MPKPIFLAGIPRKLSSPESLSELQKKFERDMPDYHIIVYTSDGYQIKFEVFYEKDFNEVKYKELKQIVKDSVKKIDK